MEPVAPAPAAAAESAHAGRTYRHDTARAPFMGILEAGWTTFALLVAIRHFGADETTKAFVAGAGQIGFLLTPVTLFLAAHWRARPSASCTCAFALGAALLMGASFAESLLVFTLCVVLSQVSAVQQGPLMLQIYTENYGPTERGKRLALPFILTALFASAFALLGGRLLDHDIAAFRWVFLLMALAATACAVACAGIPCSPLRSENVGNPWQNLSLIWRDRFFGFLLGTWMLLGLGNLIALPIRIDYLADPRHGVNASNTQIALIMLVVPAAARILSTRLWGHCFDRLHFVTTRNLLNLFFLGSVALFFFTRNLTILALAMALQGFALGGGKIIWNLWVTKIADRDRASSYMSVHMAMTGLRGALAPFIGYAILSQSSPAVVAIVSMLLIALSIFLFESTRHHPRFQR